MKVGDVMVSTYASVRSRYCVPHTVSDVLSANALNTSGTCKEIRAEIEKGEPDLTRVNKLKSELPVVVLGELYEENAPRKAGSGKMTGLFMLDYDVPMLSVEDCDELCGYVAVLVWGNVWLRGHVFAVHASPRWHGFHLFCTWVEGCETVAECQEKLMARLLAADVAEATRTGGRQQLDAKCMDVSCKDLSRCSFMVGEDMYFYRNLDLEVKEVYDNGSGNGGSDSHGEGLDGDVHVCDSEHSSADMGVEQHKEVVTYAEEYNGVPYSEIVSKLTRRCAPQSKLLEDGSVAEGARDNTWFKVCCILRYACDNNADWLERLAPEWALALNEEGKNRVREICKNACERKMSFSTPKTLEVVLKDAAAPVMRLDDALESAERYSENLSDLQGVPRVLPPVFREIVPAFPREWQSAAAVGLLPMLGTLCSKVRGVYLDERTHSTSFQVVVEAKFGRGKGNISDLSRLIMRPVAEADVVGNKKLNEYNDLVEQANNSKSLPQKPDVCVRKIAGDFTVAGWEATLGTSKGLHIWCNTSEIDEVSKVWRAVSFILRKAYDNDYYGRSLQSTKMFRGERKVYFNTLLCGTPKSVMRAFPNAEDGLVSRTIFFKLLEDNPNMPVFKLGKRALEKVNAAIDTLHRMYCVDENIEPVDETWAEVDFLKPAMRRWLQEKSDLALMRTDDAIEGFRRRDAVTGFRAGMLAWAIYHALNKKGALTAADKKVCTEFALWVADFSLKMHCLLFGDDVRNDDRDENTTAFRKKGLLDLLPDNFSLSDAYVKLPSMSQSGVRQSLSRLTKKGLLVSKERGMYSKVKVKKKK